MRSRHQTLLIAAVFAGSAVARADPPTLVPQEAGAFAVSLPKGWTVVPNAAQGTIIAQKDPTHKDAAQLMLTVATNTRATDDQVLDTVLRNGLPNAKVIKREALPNGGGKLLVADGEAEGITARLGAIAVAASGGVIVGVLIAKPADFDTLGGINTVVAVLASMKVVGAAAATTGSGASGGARDPIMTPEYLAGGSIRIPPPRRTLELVDLVGDWSGDDGAGRVYVASNGAYAGFSTVSTAEMWSIDVQGGVRDAFAAGFASSGGARGFKQNTAGTVAVNANNTISFHYPAQNGLQAYDVNYIIVGWFVGPEVTLLQVQGPFPQPITAKDLNDAPSNSYRNHTFVTKRPQP